MDWPLHRRLVSRVASSVGRVLVRLNVSDATSGFGAFRKSALEPILPQLNPKGFKLLLEILAKSQGTVVKEAPITFVDRRYGRSKLGWKECRDFWVSCWKLRRLFRGEHLARFARIRGEWGTPRS